MFNSCLFDHCGPMMNISSRSTMIWLNYMSFRVNAPQVVVERERVVEGEVTLKFDLALQLRLRWGLARPAQ